MPAATACLASSAIDDATIALAIIRIAHSLKLEVIAEGVETEAQLAYLRRHRCDMIQGHYFSPPVPTADMERMLADDKRLPTPVGESAPPAKLLAVDDDPDVLGGLQRLLRQDGYNILAAFGRRGLRTAGAAPGAGHPVRPAHARHGGTVFLERAKHLYPDTLRIILSGFADLESIMEAINRGAIHRFCTKPVNSLQLRENIREAFSHHALLHPPPPQDGAILDPIGDTAA